MTGWPHAIVSYADFTAGVRGRSRSNGGVAPVRGVRMQLHWHENPHYRFASDPDLGAIRAPAKPGANDRLPLAFDLQIFTSQMGDGAKLAAALPGLPLRAPCMPGCWRT